MMPAGIARPRDADEVAALVAWCNAERIPLTPRGGGTGMPGGNVGRALVLDLGALDRVEVGDDGLIRAGAGAVAQTADRMARAGGHHLPALPSSAPWCTFGGMAATDAAGARTFSRGSTRRWTEALDVVLADGSVHRLERSSAPAGEPVGEHATRWGPLRRELAALDLPKPPAVRKNSSGYGVDSFVAGGDPIDLVVGSEGTLAVVTGGVFRAERIPAEHGVAIVGVGDLDQLPALTAHAEASGATACEYFGRRLLELGQLLDDPRLADLDVRAGALLVEYAGSADAVAEGLAGWPGRVTSATLPHQVDALWGLRHAASPSIARAAGARRSIQFIEDAAVPRELLPTYVRAVGEILDHHGIDAVVFGHAGDGHLHINPLIDLRQEGWKAVVRAVLDEVTSVVSDLGGTLSGEHGDGRIRAGGLARIWREPHCRAFGVVKERLDPLGILNPGVILATPGADPLEGLADGPDLQRHPTPSPSADH